MDRVVENISIPRANSYTHHVKVVAKFTGAAAATSPSGRLK